MTKYVGRLGRKRPYLRPFGPLAREEDYRDRAHEQVSLDFQMLDELRQHYGIEDGPAQWLQLSLALARAHVPGFQTRSKRWAAPTKWTDSVVGILVVEIDLERPHAKNNIKAAAARLAKRSPWAEFLSEGSDQAETLRTQYEMGRNSPWATMMRMVYALCTEHPEKARGSWEEVRALIFAAS